MYIAYHPLYNHLVPENHRFPMEKYALLPQQLLYEGIASASNFHTPKKATQAMLQDAYMGEKTGYIANLGHGITQWTNPEHAKVFIDTVHEFQI